MLKLTWDDSNGGRLSIRWTDSEILLMSEKPDIEPEAAGMGSLLFRGMEAPAPLFRTSEEDDDEATNSK
jgi:hypothetical protein